jgi:hypothetical protein
MSFWHRAQDSNALALMFGQKARWGHIFIEAEAFTDQYRAVLEIHPRKMTLLDVSFDVDGLVLDALLPPDRALAPDWNPAHVFAQAFRKHQGILRARDPRIGLPDRLDGGQVPFLDSPDLLGPPPHETGYQCPFCMDAISRFAHPRSEEAPAWGGWDLGYAHAGCLLFYYRSK